MLSIIVCFFVISLFIRLCYFLFNFVRLKQNANNFGHKFCVLPNLLEPKKKFYTAALISYIIVIMCTLLLIFLTKEILILIIDLFCITNMLCILLLKKASEYNGVYKNGIILGMVIKWNKIGSWEKSDDMHFTLHMKNGKNINLHITENTEEVMNLFSEKIIL